MIKIEKTDVYGWDAAIRGMRNPMNSWDKSDTTWVNDSDNRQGIEFDFYSLNKKVIGDNDIDLMKRLASAGPVHAKYRRMINVTCDITAPLYWWAEFDTYKVSTVRNSCSKMHRLLATPFEMSDFSFDRLIGYKNEVKQFTPEIEEDELENESWCYYDKDYDISDYGRIRHKFKKHFRIISGSLHKDGYVFVTLHGKQYPLHRLVAKLWHPETYSEDWEVNHIDGNKQNNFANNLEWVTHKKNIKHAYENNLMPINQNTYKGKFSSEDRSEIKRLWDEGEMSKRQIANKYGVSHTCICDIINDKYKYAETVNLYETVAKPWVDTLNELRDSFLNCADEATKKQIWYAILQLLPESYNQKSTVQLNYEVLVGMYRDRKNHKLDEWHTFCDWIETLPYSELITLEGLKTKEVDNDKS